ncbi:hypothetical protein [Paracoccus sp. IB05]|uniref:hypothetical protein n=1 Tax=Paracoccus sp. IB05 TaxID=2779367 RepID=UPI0018E70593|nr:hypothetical protein [Paracoccus sp. IB05]MBJ2149791.1 hypothetical protein [Paracoccus sp. IB05]
MSWPLRALLGPTLWAVAFAVIYAAHGIGCARGWPAYQAPVGDLHHFTMILLWLLAVGAASAILWRAPRGNDTSDRIIRAGGWIGLAATILTLFPVLGLTSCGATG